MFVYQFNIFLFQKSIVKTDKTNYLTNVVCAVFACSDDAPGDTVWAG